MTRWVLHDTSEKAVGTSTGLWLDYEDRVVPHWFLQELYNVTHTSVSLLEDGHIINAYGLLTTLLENMELQLAEAPHVRKDTDETGIQE